MIPLEPAAALAWLAEDPSRWGNFGESLLWFGLAIALLRHHRRPGARAGSFWFLLFGISDLIEMHTGAWYEPMALFYFKAACVIGLAASFGAWRRASRRA